MISLNDQIDLFIADLERRKFRPNTLAAYRSDLMIAARHLLGSLDQIALDDIEAFLVTSSGAPATAARRAASLKRFFGWAKKQGLCAQNPLTDREPTRAAVRRLPRPVQHQSDLAAIDAAITVAPKPYRLIFTILRETGMRIGEVLALNLDVVLLEPGREGLRVREPKNGSERIAPLGANVTPKSLRGLRALVKELKGQPGYVPVFRSNRSTRVSYSAAQYQWAQLCERAGLVESIDGQKYLRYTLHQLRHTRGSELVRQGQPMEIVQRVLGHRDIRSTQGYAELDDQQLREALEQAQ
jgi:integrase/recombinase XerD